MFAPWSLTPQYKAESCQNTNVCNILPAAILETLLLLKIFSKLGQRNDLIHLDDGVKGSVANYVVNFNQNGSVSVIYVKFSNNNLQ